MKLGLGRWQRLAQRLQHRLASKATILMYHRVAAVDLDPWSLCVTPQHFAEQMEVLQKFARPIGLQQLTQAHSEGNIPHRAVAITFDDGYADNLHYAKPLLERYGIPATIFISTGYIGNEREFWWDELERLLLTPGKLPDRLSLDLNDRRECWELGAATDYSQAAYRTDRHCRAWDAKPGSRMWFYYTIWQALRPLPAAERQQALAEIQIWANAEPNPRATHRALLPDELSSLGQGKLVEIGAHTVAHPFLSAQSPDLQRDEIQRSKADLERMLDRSVTSFSYPFGDRTSQTIELVKAAGFNCACSTHSDLVWQQSNCFDLPRFAVEDWTGAEFAQQLQGWFHE